MSLHNDDLEELSRALHRLRRIVDHDQEGDVTYASDHDRLEAIMRMKMLLRRYDAEVSARVGA